MAKKNRLFRSPVQLLAWLSLVFVLASAIGTLGLALAGCRLTSTILPLENYWQFLNLLGGLAFAILGTLIVQYRPENRIGRLSSLIGFTLALSTFSESYARCSLVGDVALPERALLTWLAYVTPILGITLTLTLFPFWYPDGQFLTPRWRRAALTLYGLIAGTALLITLMPGPMIDNGVDVSLATDNPLGLRFLPVNYAPTIRRVLAVTILIAGFMAIASLVVRYLRSSGDTRQQIKWFAYFLATVVSLQFVIEIYGEFINPAIFDSLLFLVVITAVFLGFPTVVGIAVFKYRLYDIDLIIRRTLVYSLLVALLAIVYFGGIVLIQSLLRPLTGQESPVAIVISTLIIAALFMPMRRRIQDLIDRRFYRRRYDAEKTLAQFAQTAREEVELDALTAELLQVVLETMQPDLVSLWLKPDDRNDFRLKKG